MSDVMRDGASARGVTPNPVAPPRGTARDRSLTMPAPSARERPLAIPSVRDRFTETSGVPRVEPAAFVDCRTIVRDGAVPTRDSPG